jgi:hypothetical protein
VGNPTNFLLKHLVWYHKSNTIGHLTKPTLLLLGLILDLQFSHYITNKINEDTSQCLIIYLILQIYPYIIQIANKNRYHLTIPSKKKPKYSFDILNFPNSFQSSLQFSLLCYSQIIKKFYKI